MAKDPEDFETGATDAGPGRRRRKLSAIMMADVSGFSRLMGADDEGTVNLIRDFHRRVQGLIERFEGRVVDTAGDSVFGEFDSVVNAVRCARQIQADLANTNADHPVDRRIETRIGVHLGDVIIEDYRVYGDGVNIAARLEPLAEPGGICLSEAVYQQVRDKLDLPVEDLGLRELKNIQHPIRLYKIPPLSASAPAVGPAPPRAATPLLVEAPVASSATRRDRLTTSSTLILTIVGVFLMLSSFLLFPTAGVLQTGGAVLLGLTLGRLWDRIGGTHGNILVGLGLGIASGALWTDWSRVTNSMFVLGGLIVAALGVHRRRR